MDLSDTPISSRYFTRFEHFLCGVSSLIKWAFLIGVLLYCIAWLSL